MARVCNLQIALLIILALTTSACKPGSSLDPKAIRGWAESEGYQWIEGPDEIRTEQAFFDYINGAAQPIIDLGQDVVVGCLRVEQQFNVRRIETESGFNRFGNRLGIRNAPL